MTETKFVEINTCRWQKFENLIGAKRSVRFKDMATVEEFPLLYRSLCRDLNLARARRYSVPLIEKLNTMVWTGHHLLYRSRDQGAFSVVGMLIRDFPATVRKFAIPLLLCHFLFYGAAAITYGYTVSDQSRAISILGEEMALNMLESYDPSKEHFLKPRGITNDADMFGFYIENNISIGFRTFASGGLAGIGSLFTILFNAVVMGAATGLVVNAGFGSTFFPFVVGHSAFELTGILICGVAGFQLGRAIIFPGRLSRAEALKESAREVLPLVVGAALFIFLAACIEAFWSAGVRAPEVKYIAGAGLWSLVLLFFIFGGRNAHRKN